MSIKTTKPVEDAAKLGGKLPAYYATKTEIEAKIPLTRLNETPSGTISALSGNAYLASWQRRNGWVRLAAYVSGASVANNTQWLQIVGNGLPFAGSGCGLCTLAGGGTAMALIKITAGGSITVENSAGSAMTGLVFDITLPAQNP
ncbi:hypothetical protein [Christensenella timonensis]|uniref:hypothetical protein n=1 Tax=Christensenella timonensis TaxID=1816678 RepID=UPI000835D41A|nr:hypothetical protein [Christensenella timonensis]